MTGARAMRPVSTTYYLGFSAPKAIAGESEEQAE
jgi:hypothetical protein